MTKRCHLLAAACGLALVGAALVAAPHAIGQGYAAHGNCGTNNWSTGYGSLTTSGDCAQPGFGNLSGTASNSQLAAMAGDTIKGNNSGSSASPSDLTQAQAQALLGFPVTPQGRLTLTSGTPVQTSAVTGATTVYYDSQVGNIVWAGGAPLVIASDEISMGLSSSNITSGNLYDIFAVNSSGSLKLCTGPAWSSASARGSGAGTTQLARSSGIWTNAVSLAHCYGGAAGTTDYGSVAANEATFLGTIYATANGQTGVNLNPSAASGGAAPIVGVYNAYNRVRASTKSIDSTTSWTYGTASWRDADNSSSNRISWVDGLGQSLAIAKYADGMQNSGSGAQNQIGIGFNGNNPTAYAALLYNGASATLILNSVAEDRLVALGFNYAQAMENQNSGTGTYYGQSGGVTFMTLSLEFDL